MSKPANKTLIGAFVAGSAVLAVAAVIIFGSGRLFKHTFVNVMYFQGSVKGLNVGSPVTFRGVRIGSVSRIELRYNAKDLTFLIPVYVEIDPDKMVYVGHAPGTQHTTDLIRKGLRAQLEMQSLVTGQLGINLDLYSRDKPAVLFGLDTRYDEIPTIPSDLEQLTRKVQSLPVQDLFDRLLSVSKGLDRLVNAPDTQETVQSVNRTVKELRQTIQAVNRQIDPIMVNVRMSTDSLRSASKNIDLALAGDRGLPFKIDKTLGDARSALKQAEKTLQTAEALITDKSSMLDDADAALVEVSDAARSFRLLSDYLERHPESVIWGKKP
jgi:paraquat-inducible protein B